MNLAPADIEDALRRHLTPILGVPVFAAITPMRLPPESVTITRTGGTDQSFVLDEARISLDARSTKAASAALALIQDSIAAIHTAAQVGRIGDLGCYQATRIGGPYLNPDPDNTTQHRYTAAMVLSVRQERRK